MDSHLTQHPKTPMSIQGHIPKPSSSSFHREGKAFSDPSCQTLIPHQGLCSSCFSPNWPGSHSLTLVDSAPRRSSVHTSVSTPSISPWSFSSTVRSLRYHFLLRSISCLIMYLFLGEREPHSFHTCLQKLAQEAYSKNCWVYLTAQGRDCHGSHSYRLCFWKNISQMPDVYLPDSQSRCDFVSISWRH